MDPITLGLFGAWALITGGLVGTGLKGSFGKKQDTPKRPVPTSHQVVHEARNKNVEEAIQELQAQVDLPAEPEVINEAIDELAGVKTVTTRMPDGSQQVRRVRLPLTDEEREQNDAIIAQMNDLIPRMREYIDSGPSDYDPMGAIGQFNALVANFNQKSQKQLDDMAEKLNIRHFRKNIAEFQNSYVGLFEREMDKTMERGKSELQRMGYGPESSKYRNFEKDVANLRSQGMVHLRRDAEHYGRNVANEQRAMDMALYQEQKDRDLREIDTKQIALKHELNKQLTDAQLRQNQFEANRQLYGQLEGQMQNRRLADNQQFTSLGNFFQQDNQNYQNKLQNLANLKFGIQNLYEQRLQNDRAFGLNQQNMQLAQDRFRAENEFSLPRFVNTLGARTVGTVLGNWYGSDNQNNRNNQPINLLAYSNR